MLTGRVFGAGVALVQLVAAGSILPQRPERTTLTRCEIPGLTGDVRCGVVSVGEVRSRHSGPRIDISVIVARATGANRAPDPVFLFAGGPGQSASGMVDFASAAFAETRARRDLVFADARGTGRSKPLNCKLYRSAADLFGELYPPASVRFCRDSLARVADLSQLTTPVIADDIDDVRRALGYGRINIYGTSYGSRLALVYLRRHPEGVRSVLMKAVAPPDMPAPASYAQDGERALALLVRDCKGDSACAASFPRFEDELREVLARAGEGILRALRPGSTSASDSVGLSNDLVATTIMGLLQSVSSRAAIPYVIHQAFAGDPTALMAFITQYRGALDGGGIAMGMHLSVICSEDPGPASHEEITRDERGTFLGTARVRAQTDACRAWTGAARTRAKMNADRQPVQSSAPVLLVSGELDPNTPPRWADRAAQTLPNSRHVVLPHVAHNFSSAASCGAQFMAEFFEKGSAKELDLSCVDRISLPPFVVPRK